MSDRTNQLRQGSCQVSYAGGRGGGASCLASSWGDSARRDWAVCAQCLPEAVTAITTRNERKPMDGKKVGEPRRQTGHAAMGWAAAGSPGRAGGQSQDRSTASPTVPVALGRGREPGSGADGGRDSVRPIRAAQCYPAPEGEGTPPRAVHLEVDTAREISQPRRHGALRGPSHRGSPESSRAQGQKAEGPAPQLAAGGGELVFSGDSSTLRNGGSPGGGRGQRRPDNPNVKH